MADDKKSQDEYEYPPEEYYKGGEYIPPDDSSESLGQEPPPRSSLLPRRVLLLVGFLIAIAVVYMVISFTNARKRAELAQPTPTPDLTASANIPPTPTTPARITQPQPAPEILPSPMDEAALQRLAQQNQINQQNMANLQNQMGQLQSQINNVTNSISTLNSQMQVIANEIRAIAIDRNLRGRGIGLTTLGTKYTLKALVPGRAWLQTREGSTTSVTIGDRLPGYGIIQSINTDQGVVTTSSGTLIQYGPKDS